MNFPHERRHFRIVYPTTLRPTFLVGGVECPVLDVSEGGLRFRVAGVDVPEVGADVEGVVRLRRAGAVPVRGRVVRVSAGEVAVELLVGLPFRAILEEQRFLLQSNRWLSR